MSDTIALVALTGTDLDAYLATRSERTRRWVASQHFRAQPLTHCIVPNDEGGISEVLVGVVNSTDVNTLAHLPLMLPPGDYVLADRGLALDAMTLGAAAITRKLLSFSRRDLAIEKKNRRNQQAANATNCFFYTIHCCYSTKVSFVFDIRHSPECKEAGKTKYKTG